MKRKGVKHSHRLKDMYVLKIATAYKIQCVLDVGYTNKVGMRKQFPTSLRSAYIKEDRQTDGKELCGG